MEGESVRYFCQQVQDKIVPRENVIVVGAGLAGLSCAFELIKRRRAVTILESRRVLGGRTASWIEDGMPVESGLHTVRTGL